MMDHLSLVPYEGGSSAGGGAGGGAKYKECLRNHAAAMGGQAFDGCGEYMPASPDSFKCAACGCHRSFHRRAGGGLGGGGVTAPFFFSPPPPPPPQHHHHHPVLQGFVPSSAPMRPPQLALPYHAVPPAAWHHGLLDPAAGARSGSETPPRADDCSPGCGGGSGSFGRKRHRTKFTPEQKERMRDFAERQGWRINRDDGGALDRFCVEIGVKRNVLKVWMHNHKHQLASPTSAGAASAAAAAGIGMVGMGSGLGGSMGAGLGVGMGDGDGDGDDDDDTDDDSPPRAAVSSPSPSPISV
ncbi:zinc-finger homeodomain protein 8-like isoform X2 [Lolium rigidum]|uniref:zinc-finger homeodomain protein 8-like isoform X2 n=1 Tax=Lolium rigidum TaxID=89674 RepID=UPI001F5DE4BD|nr:zinc-finger homeodomain protein 8-like isoform X2 [Lolium rigidum]